MFKPTPQQAFADTVAEVIRDIYERTDLDQEEGANYRLVKAGRELVYQVTKQIDGTLPTITAIAETNQGEYGRGKIEVTKAVRRAIKSVRSV